MMKWSSLTIMPQPSARPEFRMMVVQLTAAMFGRVSLRPRKRPGLWRRNSIASSVVRPCPHDRQCHVERGSQRKGQGRRRRPDGIARTLRSTSSRGTRRALISQLAKKRLGDGHERRMGRLGEATVFLTLMLPIRLGGRDRARPIVTINIIHSWNSVAEAGPQ